MTQVVSAHSASLDGFIADSDDNPERVFGWYASGDTPSRYYGDFRMSKVSADIFDEAVSQIGAVVAGRRTYEVSEPSWQGEGPLPGVPLFVVTHRVPDDAGDAPYTFVTDGIESAVEQARAAAGDKNVGIMGGRTTQECLRAGLLDEVQVDLVPVLLGRGVRLFDLGDDSFTLEPSMVVEAPGVTHLRYRVAK
jgi:dihydrofolate reductase